MSNRLDRLFLLEELLWRMKYFWAWLATWWGSPLPSFCRPRRNILCSSSVHGTPASKNNPFRDEHQSKSLKIKRKRRLAQA
ncbi:unnamed protein product [Spirodela intermedia]|uniref:Uncharacterized protein n=1 Tax=Spirodela intermedia TaxID=51605 RepID=A0A7I8JVM7_SPIIN|nr:unnamed protein product [Spirodela intermedia]CAA6673693.1 unnamed protein product [Spirodela intermedia]